MNSEYFPEIAGEICDALSKSTNTLILSHANPDADSISSLLAMEYFIDSRKTSVTLVSGEGELPGTIAFLQADSKIRRLQDVKFDAYDLIIFVDCADVERVTPGDLALEDRMQETITPIINIDHHITNSGFGTINLVDPEAAATAEILTLLAAQLDVSMSSRLATILMSGIQGDTLGLKTPSSLSRTFHISGDLMAAGADLTTIVDFMFRVKPYSTIRLWGEVLYRANRIGGLVWAEITPEILASSGAAPSEGEGIVNFLAGADDAKAAALLHKSNGGYRVSMRSRTEDVDVSELAALYNGGGHSRAAGCRIDGDTPERDAFLEDIASRLPFFTTS